MRLGRQRGRCDGTSLIWFPDILHGTSLPSLWSSVVVVLVRFGFRIHGPPPAVPRIGNARREDA